VDQGNSIFPELKNVKFFYLKLEKLARTC
jgi:hypothetical protein